MNLFHVQSLIILILLFVGVYFRRQRQKHVRIMSIAIAWDLILVLQIELTRGAINKAIQVTTNKWLLNYHVAVAVTVVVLYGVLVMLGRRLLRGDESIRKLHKALGGLTLLLRISTFVTSFLIA